VGKVAILILTIGLTSSIKTNIKKLIGNKGKENIILKDFKNNFLKKINLFFLYKDIIFLK
jgi:hypothetical protein